MVKVKVKVGSFENYYNVNMIGKEIHISFDVEDLSIELVNFEHYPRMSEETNAFAADIMVNGKVVGYCRNEGRGGCASYRGYESTQPLHLIDAQLRIYDDYIFPKLKLSLSDVLDNLASHMIIYKENKIKTYPEAFKIVQDIIKYSNELREKYSSK